MTRSTRSAPFRRAREQRFSFAEERKLAMLYTQVQKQFEVENKREIQRATSFSRDFYGLFLSPLFIDELQCNSFFLYTEGVDGIVIFCFFLHSACASIIGIEENHQTGNFLLHGV